MAQMDRTSIGYMSGVHLVQNIHIETVTFSLQNGYPEMAEAQNGLHQSVYSYLHEPCAPPLPPDEHGYRCRTPCGAWDMDTSRPRYRPLML